MTTINQAPDRIRVAQDADGFWTCREAVSGSQEYVRADLAEPDSKDALGIETYKRQFSEANTRAKNLTYRLSAMMDALKALLPEVDAEIEQRQSSGNDEYWLGLKALSDAAHAAIAKAGA